MQLGSASLTIVTVIAVVAILALVVAVVLRRQVLAAGELVGVQCRSFCHRALP